MSKNLTRKGLALGAVVALGSTLIAGSPALAANEVSLATKVGSTYSLISGETFTLSAFAGASIPSSSWGSLKTKVTNNSAIGYTTGATQTGVTTFAGAGSKASTVTSTLLEIDVNGTSTVPTVGAAEVTLAVAATDAGNFSVQSFLDSNGNDAIDEGEFSSAVRTVTFVKAADVTWTNTLTAPVLAGTTVTATVSAAPAINLAQIATSVQIGFATLAAGAYTAYDTTGATAPAAVSVVNAGVFSVGEATTYDATADNLKFTSAVGTAISAGNYVSQALFDAAGAAIAEVGSESIKTVAAGTIVRADGAVVAAGANTIGTGANILTRAETKTVPVSIQLYTTWTASTTDVDVKAGAGIAAVVTVAETVDTTTTITVGGKTLTSTTGSTTFDATTNADGKLVFDVVSSTGKATDFVTISAVSQGVATAASGVITWTATSPNAIVDVKGLGTNAVRTIAKLGSYSIDYAVNDNFGQPLADGYRIAAAYQSAVGTAATKYATVVGGKATLSVTDASTATGTYSVVAVLEKFNTATSNWDAIDTNGATTGTLPNVSSTVYVATQSAVATLAATSTVVTAATATATTAKALTTSALAAVDTRVNTSATAHGLTGGFALAGTVADALGTPVSGQTVTISGAGLGFSADTTYLSVGSITVQTDNVGAFAGVEVYSNTAGKKTITMTSGAISKTIDVTFAAALETAGTVVTLDAPATILPGRTLVVTGTVADKFGNPVTTIVPTTGVGAGVATLTVVYTGPGLIVGSLPVDTDASGAFSFRVLMGANETGSASVSASYDADGATTTVAAVTVAKTVVIAAAAVVTASVAGITGYVATTVRNASGKAVTVTVNGRVLTPRAPNSAAQLFRFRAKAGKATVVVQVDGVTVSSRTVTVK